MSEQVARAHTSQSNRAKTRIENERKAVFKSVVENPFRVQWPPVTTNVQNAVLAWVVDNFQGVAQYNLDREHASRKRRRACSSGGSRSSKRAKTAQADEPSESSGAIGAVGPSSMSDAVVEPAVEPSVLKHVVFGINEVTRRLEHISQSYREGVTPVTTQQGARVPSTPPSTSSGRLVIACRADVNPPILLGHFPNLVAACNSMHQGSSSVSPGKTWLIPMSKGAEDTLADAMGLRRVSVMLIENTIMNFSALEALLGNVPLLSAPWLCPPTRDRTFSLIPTHIKQLRTSAPKDMKAAKEKRFKERAAAKDRRRSGQKNIPKRVTLSNLT
ncbi:hypothetical protein C8Q76DRAFT_453485 [Earliella scabrosa]|nr:hypothetical protein C8Q76DRAFT_453485 [Earliella scabrosa]